MTANWTFENGQLLARTDADTPLLALPVDHGIDGQLLAEFINCSPSLERLLLAGYDRSARPRTDSRETDAGATP